MEIVKKCEWCHKTFIAQMVTARFCSSKCCDQAYRYKRKVQSGKYTPADSSIDLSTLSRRVNERKHLNESLKDKQFLSPSEAAKLLGVCRSTIYNYLWHQDLKAKQFRVKTACDFVSLLFVDNDTIGFSQYFVNFWYSVIVTVASYFTIL